MKFEPKLIEKVVGKARLAPSTHNTQPARWHFRDGGSIQILADHQRFLPICDPTNRDAGLSCGAAAEGTLLALKACGLEFDVVEDLWQSNETPDPDKQCAAVLKPLKRYDLPDLGDQIEKRFTWRGHFAEAGQVQCKNLQNWASNSDDVTLVHDASDIAELAELNDNATLLTMRDSDFRNELLGWMRLSKQHPDYQHDGLNSESMHMSSIEALAAGIVLKSPTFDILDAVGLARSIVSEKSKTLSATAIALFHRPIDESPFETGRHFYRMWLNLTRLGFAAWPMAVVADHEPTAQGICNKHGIPDNRRFVNALRVGIANKNPPRARLPVADLVL